jgi:hypothetical protein
MPPSRLLEKERRREERIAQEQAQGGYPPRKPPGTRNALDEFGSLPGPLGWIERNFGKMFVVSMVLSVIFTVAITALVIALVFKLV